MNRSEKKSVLGIITDEDAMFELLAKFLSKEGYEVKRVLHEDDADESLSLVIHAPARSSDSSRRILQGLKMKKLLINQSVDEDLSRCSGDGMIVLSERPLNLKELSDTIRRTIGASSYVGTVQ